MTRVNNHRNRSEKSGRRKNSPRDPRKISDDIKKYYVAICFFVGLHVVLLLWFSGFNRTIADGPISLLTILPIILYIVVFIWLRFQDCVWKALDQAPDCPIRYRPRAYDLVIDLFKRLKVKGASLFAFEEINNVIELRQLPLKPLRAEFVLFGFLLILIDLIMGPIWIQCGLNRLFYAAGLVSFLIVGYRIMSAVVNILATNHRPDLKTAAKAARRATNSAARRATNLMDEQFNYNQEPIIINEEEVRRKLSAEADPWAEQAAKSDDRTAPNKAHAGAGSGDVSPAEERSDSVQKSDDESPIGDTRPRMRLVSPEEQVGFISKLFWGLLGGSLLFVTLLLSFAGFHNDFSSLPDRIEIILLLAGADALVCWGIMQHRIWIMLKKANELYPAYARKTKTNQERDYGPNNAFSFWFFLAFWKLVYELNIVIKLRHHKVKQVDKQLPWLMLAMYSLEYFFSEQLQAAGLGNLFLAGGIVVFLIIAFEIQNAARAILKNEPKLYILVNAPPPDDKNNGKSVKDD